MHEKNSHGCTRSETEWCADDLSGRSLNPRQTLSPIPTGVREASQGYGLAPQRRRTTGTLRLLVVILAVVDAPPRRPRLDIRCVPQRARNAGHTNQLHIYVRTLRTPMGACEKEVSHEDSVPHLEGKNRPQQQHNIRLQKV